MPEPINSIFRYEIISDETHPLQRCSYGSYYKNARKRSRTEDEEKGKGEQKRKCVIMDYEHNHAIAQIKLSDDMSDEYALEVLHIDNKEDNNGDINDKSKVKVIYPHFEDTVSGWVEKLVKNNANKSKEQILQKASEINKGLKDEVIPMTRKLWKLLVEMKKKEIETMQPELEAKQILDQKENKNQGHWMPLINKVPKVLNLHKGKGNLDHNYPLKIIERVLKDVYQIKDICRHKEGQSLHKWLTEAVNFWKCNSTLLDDAGKHPALYDSAEKSRFLALFHRCAFVHGLEPWLENHMDWVDFRNRFNRAQFKKVYKNALNYTNSNPYTRGSDVVRFTRNALQHFEENYMKSKEKPRDWKAGEIVEILDEDLAVCSLHYNYARKIINNQLPNELTEEGWKEEQAKKWKILKDKGQTKVEDIIEAYQPAPLRIYTRKFGNERWNEVTKEIGEDSQLEVRTNFRPVWKKAKEVFNPPRTLELWTMEGWKEAEVIIKEANEPEFFTRTKSSDGWKNVKVIKEEANQQLELKTEEGWKKATQIFEANQPPRLLMRRGQTNDYWIEAFEAERPRKFLEKKNWYKAKDTLKEFFDSLK